MKLIKSTGLISLAAFLVFFIPRLISLGGDLANYDARYWYPRMDRFTEAVAEGRWVDTYQAYHPGVTLMWLSGFSVRAVEQAARWTGRDSFRTNQLYFPYVHLAAKLPLVVSISILGTICFWCLRKLIGNTILASLFVFFLSFEPFFLGISRFLHLTALTAMLMFASFLLMLVFLQRWEEIGSGDPDPPAGGGSDPMFWRSCAFFSASVLYGLAILTKVDGVLAGVASSAVILVVLLRQRRALSQTLRTWLILSTAHLGIACLVFFVFFPAMWIQPIQVVGDIIREGFGGTAFVGTGADRVVPFHWLYYSEALVVRSLPTTVALFVLGVILALKNRVGPLKRVRPYVLLYLVVLWVVLSIPNKTKDRYLVTFYPALMVLVASAFCWLLEKLRLKGKVAVAGLLAGIYILTLYRYHPVYSFYHSELIGGPAGYEKTGFEVKVRGEWYAQAAAWINHHDSEAANRNAIFTDQEQMHSFKWFFWGDTFANPKDMPGEDKRANYFVVEKKFLPRVPEACQLVSTVGPRAPMPYDLVYIFSCGDAVDKSGGW